MFAFFDANATLSVALFHDEPILCHIDHAATPKDCSMNILLIGSGGREHALAWSLADSPLTSNLVIAPGNPGMAPYGEMRPVAADDLDGLCALAVEISADLVVIGPEVPALSCTRLILRGRVTLRTTFSSMSSRTECCSSIRSARRTPHAARGVGLTPPPVGSKH